MAKQKSKARTWAEYGVARILIGALRVLPLKAAYLAAGLLDRMLPKLRRTSMQNLAMAFPELSLADHRRITDGVFRSVGRLLFSFARFPSMSKSNIGDWISYHGLENYIAAKKKDRGVLVATAHLGNWELSAFAHAFLTEPMNVMVRPLDNPLVDALVEHRRTLSGNMLLVKKDAARSVLRALKNNEAVGVLIDQNTASNEGVFINFFGKTACAGTGFVKLAQHSQAPVVPGFALWDEEKRRYILYFLPEVPLTGNVATDTQAIHTVLEEAIRGNPDQWMWIHRRWKTRPSGEAAFY